MAFVYIQSEKKKVLCQLCDHLAESYVALDQHMTQKHPHYFEAVAAMIAKPEKYDSQAA